MSAFWVVETFRKGLKNPSGRGLNIAFKIGGGLLVVWFIFSGKAGEILTDITQSFKNEVIAACKVEKVNVAADIFLTNGEADAGFLVNILVNKTAKNGEVTITVRLSSTEGNIQKDRTVFMNKGQRSWIAIQFPEPTINAQQVTATAGCRTI